jgi:hypothetical protein
MAEIFRYLGNNLLILKYIYGALVAPNFIN